MTTDNARTVLSDPRAPADERFDAETELTKSVMPTALSSLLPREDLQPIISHIMNDLADQELAKAGQRGRVIPFPSQAAWRVGPLMFFASERVAAG